MIRNYNTPELLDSVEFFVGTEVEHTPAYGKQTLFVVGVQPVATIEEKYHDKHCEHIFFGANHSFNPGVDFPQDAAVWKQWDSMIKYFLDKGIQCTLDIPLDHAEAILESVLIEHNLFIPQIRIPLPYVKQYNYNTMIKIDDKGFNETNPGVWCHNLHDLLCRDNFTDWQEYSNDEPTE